MMFSPCRRVASGRPWHCLAAAIPRPFERADRRFFAADAGGRAIERRTTLRLQLGGAKLHAREHSEGALAPPSRFRCGTTVEVGRLISS